MSPISAGDLQRAEQQIFNHYPHLLDSDEVERRRFLQRMQQQLNNSCVVIPVLRVSDLIDNIENNIKNWNNIANLQHASIDTSQEAFNTFHRKDTLPSPQPPQLSECSDEEDDHINFKHLQVSTIKSNVPEQYIDSSEDEVPLFNRCGACKCKSSVVDKPYKAHSKNWESAPKKVKLVSVRQDDEGLRTVTLQLPMVLRETYDISFDFRKVDISKLFVQNSPKGRISDCSSGRKSLKDSKAISTSGKDCSLKPKMELKNYDNFVDDEEISHLMSELTEPNDVETWRATNALNNINNNIGDNYDALNTIKPSSSQLELSQNSSGSKPRKYNRKRPAKIPTPKGPPKKRGRKQGSKNRAKIPNTDLVPKSDLARYVELFANNCEMLPGSSTPAASSTVSQQMVTSTTQHLDEESVQQPVSYYLNGDWANGGTCQLATLDASGQMTQESYNLSTPFVEDIVDYIDSPNIDSENIFARVLDNGSVQLVSGRWPSTNGQLVEEQPSMLCHVDTVAHMQTSPTLPPPAHTVDGVLDLSVASKSKIPTNCIQLSNDDDCGPPIDLSIKSLNQNNFFHNIIANDNDDHDNFIRRVFENNDFDYNETECATATEEEEVPQPNSKASLDMPSLEIEEHAEIISKLDIISVVKLNALGPSWSSEDNAAIIERTLHKQISCPASNPTNKEDVEKEAEEEEQKIHTSNFDCITVPGVNSHNEVSLESVTNDNNSKLNEQIKEMPVESAKLNIATTSANADVLDFSLQNTNYCIDLPDNEANDVNLTVPKIVLSDKSSPYNKEDTLKPIELVLEDMLDYEEDDDTLSLTASSFGSPEHVHTTPPRQYKIPKIVASDPKTVIAVNTTETITKVSETKTTPKRYEQIKRTVQNTNVAKLPNVATTTVSPLLKYGMFQPATEVTCSGTNSQLLDMDVEIQPLEDATLLRYHQPFEIVAINRGIQTMDIASLFGITCLPFLVDKCFALAACPLSHTFCECDVLASAIETLPKSDLHVAYNFMCNHSRLFQLYFPVFCKTYTDQKNREKLLNMVYDCEKHRDSIQYLRNIFFSLVQCGLNKLNACRLILVRCAAKTTETIDMLLLIIMESDWSMFCDYIERFAKVPNYHFCINVIYKMAPTVLRAKDSRLQEILFTCLLTLSQADAALVQHSSDLMQILKSVGRVSNNPEAPGC